MPFEKGNTLGTGRPKGLENKATNKARELFLIIMEGEVDNIKLSLEEVRKESYLNYLNVLSKFFPYFIPKKVDITSDGKELSIPLTEWVEAKDDKQEPKI